MYTPQVEEKITRALLSSPKSRPREMKRLYPQNIQATRLKYSSKALPSEGGSSGPATPCETPAISTMEMETALLKSTRGNAFAKIARRNPLGWQKIVKAQLEHEKFLNNMRYYGRGFLQNKVTDHVENFHSPQITQERSKSPANLKSFQIPWKNGTSKFITRAEQKERAFKSLKAISTDPPQTPPMVKSSKDFSSFGLSSRNKFENINENRQKYLISQDEYEKPFSSLISKIKQPLPLRMKKLSLFKTVDKSLESKTPSIIFKQPRQVNSFHAQMQSGLLTMARRVDMESPETNYSTSETSDLFQLGSSQSNKSFSNSSQIQLRQSSSSQSSKSRNQQPSSSQKSGMSSSGSSNRKSSFQQPRITLKENNSEKSVSFSVPSLSHSDSNYLRDRLLKEAADDDERNNESEQLTLQQKFENAMEKSNHQDVEIRSSQSSSNSNVTKGARKTRMFQQQSPLLPVFIQSPYEKRMTLDKDDRIYLKELHDRLKAEREAKAEANSETALKIFTDFHGM